MEKRVNREGGRGLSSQTLFLLRVNPNHGTYFNRDTPYCDQSQQSCKYRRKCRRYGVNNRRIVPLIIKSLLWAHILLRTLSYPPVVRSVDLCGTVLVQVSDKSNTITSAHPGSWIVQFLFRRNELSSIHFSPTPQKTETGTGVRVFGPKATKKVELMQEQGKSKHKTKQRKVEKVQ